LRCSERFRRAGTTGTAEGVGFEPTMTVTRHTGPCGRPWGPSSGGRRQSGGGLVEDLIGFAPEPPVLSPEGEPPGTSAIGRPPHAAYPEPGQDRKAKPQAVSDVEPCDPAQNPGVDKLSDRRKRSPHLLGPVCRVCYYVPADLD
jgi:hypothetical protein